mmetsp:Transcript_63621/g.165361  ORF Transcript_63621/g.165361 Transcript_63621/m.165361 type:complete len:338 (-) Transcript_63621:248-1261(-)
MQLAASLSLVLWALEASTGLSGRIRAAPRSGPPPRAAEPGSELQERHLGRLRSRAAHVAHRGTYLRLPGGSSRCDNGTLGLASDAVEVVVSTWSDDLRWLEQVDVATTVYVHNRSSTTQTHCYTRSGECFHHPVGSLRLAEKSQEELNQSNAHRRHKVRFVDIPNFGDEALAYLTHIVDNYDRLPEAVVFLHGHESAWHAPRSMKRILNSTCFSQAVGYHNLNHGGGAKPLNFCVSHQRPARNIEVAARDEVETLLKQNWLHVFKAAFNNTFPRRVCLDCCAQFVVSRARLHNHPRSFYDNLLQLVRDGKTTMEREWRMVFVPEDVLTSASNQYVPL